MKIFHEDSNEQKILDTYFKGNHFSKNSLMNVTLDKSLVVHLYFGIKTIKRKKIKVNGWDRERTILLHDKKFQNELKVNSKNISKELVREICKVCNYVKKQSLVIKDGGQCYFDESEISQYKKSK